MAIWEKPDFKEISLSMEVTAYVNTDRDLPQPDPGAEHKLTAQELQDVVVCKIA